MENIGKMNSVVHPYEPAITFDDVVTKIRWLGTERHHFKSLIIDPITVLSEKCQEKWNRIFLKYEKDEKDKELMDFGFRYWAKVKADWKNMRNRLLELDMNVLVTAHQKDLYNSSMQKIGVTFDSIKDDGYIFDNIFKIDIINKKLIAKTIKQRVDLLAGETGFPDEFEWSYDNFIKYYGDIIEKETEPVIKATKEQVQKLKALIALLNTPTDTVEKWLDKANADTFEDFTSEQIEKCIAYLQKQVDELNQKLKEGVKNDKNS